MAAAAANGFPRKDDFGIPAGTAYLNAAMIHPMPHVGYYSGSVETHDSPLDPEHAETPVSWTLGRDASNHFEAGTIGGNAAGAFAYSASLSVHSAARCRQHSAHRQPLLRRLEQEVPRLGYPLLTPRGSTSPIITFGAKDGMVIEKRLTAGRVAARVSKYWFRFSPSVYNDMRTWNKRSRRCRDPRRIHHEKRV
jgi:hypothetical protein